MGQLCTTDLGTVSRGSQGSLGALLPHPQIQEVAFIGYEDQEDHPVGSDETIPFGEEDFLPVFIKPDGSAVKLGRGKQATSNSDFLVDAETQKFLVVTDSPTLYPNPKTPVSEDLKSVVAQGPIAMIRRQAEYGAFPKGTKSDESVPFVLTDNLKPGATIVIGRKKLPHLLEVITPPD